MKIVRISEQFKKIDFRIETDTPFEKEFEISEGKIKIIYINNAYEVFLSGNLFYNDKQYFKVKSKFYYLSAKNVYYDIKIEFIEMSIEKYYYVKSDNLVINNYCLHFKEGIVSCNNEIYLNNKLIKEAQIVDNDIIYFRQYFVIYTSNFIVTNFKAKLSLFNAEYKPIKSPLKEIEFKKKYRSINNFIQLDYKLNEPIPKLNLNHNLLIFQMGPALTMSLASLSVGCLSLYNAINQGREFIEVVPMLILPVTMLISTIVWSPLQRIYEKNHQKKYNFKRIQAYKKYLDELCITQLKLNNQINDDRKKRYMDFNKIKFTIENKSDELFQKLPNHDDFLSVFIGTGQSFNDIKLIKPLSISGDDEINNLINEYQQKLNYMENSLFELNILKYHYISVVSKTKLMFKYILMQLVTYFGYDVLQIVFVIQKDEFNKYAYLRYVPHASNTLIRYIVSNNMEAKEVYNQLNKNITTVVCIIDNINVDTSIFKDAHLLYFVDDLKKINIYSEVIISNNGYFSNIKLDNRQYEVVTEFLEDINIESLLLMLFNIHLETSKSLNVITMSDLYPNLNIKQNYINNHTYDSIEAKIGYHDEEIFLIDLHEKSMGPHALVAGTTGSGKSIFLNTLILSLAINYHPKYLNFIIIDYKGGSLVNAFDNDLYHLPHLVGTITNLDNFEINRYLIGLNQEVIKRQELFKKMLVYTNEPVMNIDLYQRLYKDEYQLPFLSHLVIIVDEFAELKKHKPDFMQDLISISRIGRSLGIHLILATQKPSGVVDDQIWSNAKSKICLKVQTASDSKEMIGTDLAYKLLKPGEMYLYCNQMLTYAITAISTMPIKNKKDTIKVLLIDKMKHVLKEERVIIKKSVKEIDYLVQQIIENSNSFIAKPLWQEPLKFSSFDDILEKYKLSLKPNEVLIGEVDDIAKSKQYPFIIDLNTSHHILVLSLSDFSKMLLIKSILYSVTLNSANRKILIIDFMNYDFREFNNDMIYEIIDGYNSKIITKVFYKLNNSMKNTIVIINGYENLCDMYPQYTKNLQIIMQNFYLNHLSFIVLETSSNSVKYQLLQLFDIKLVLAKTNASELLSIFNSVINVNNYDETEGITVLDNQLNFKLLKNKYAVSKGKLCKLLSRGNNKISYNGESLIFGNDYESDVEIGHNFKYNKLLLVTSLYTEDIEKYKDKFFKCGLTVKSFDDNSFEDKAVILMSVNELNKTMILRKYEIKSILWIGEGINNQYLLNYQYRNSVDEGEGLYINKGKIVKVELYE